VNFHVKYGDNEFLPALRAMGMPNANSTVYGQHVRTPPRPAYPFALPEVARALEERARVAPVDPAIRAALGDLYLFEMNWISKAIEWYEGAEALAPHDLAYHWRLMDLYLNASRADKSLQELKYLSEHLPDDRQTRQWYEFYKKEYDFDR
jgi:predicted Zn-dependent protease